MVPTTTSRQRERRLTARWQDRFIACCWLPLNLLFDLWVALTPSYEAKSGLLHSTDSPPSDGAAVRTSLVSLILVALCVLGFTLFLLLSLPPLLAHALLALTFGGCLIQVIRPKR